MAMPALKLTASGQSRPRAQDIDRHIGARLRERRIMLGITQQQMSEMIGVTYQQAHKYEKGINRIASARLYAIAQALNVEVGYFYEGMEAQRAVAQPTPKQRLLLELTRNFVAISDRRHQAAICGLARSLASENVDVAAVEEIEASADCGLAQVA